MRKIYWAAPLHDAKDREANAAAVAKFREKGFEVYLPQEHGVWEEMVAVEEAKGQSHEDAVTSVKGDIFRDNWRAMSDADMCIAYFTRPPSEGQVFEMGAIYAMYKPLYIIDETKSGGEGWPFNLMLEYAATDVFYGEDVVQEAVDYIGFSN